MSRWTLIPLLLATGCIIVVDGNDPPDTDPIRTECDVDQDGVLATTCGGLDCDDLDASVRPGADEWFDDGIDQDCDGTTEVKVDRFDLPDRSRALDWEWAPDLRALGGVLVQPTGSAVAQDLFFDPEFGAPVVLKWRSAYDVPVGVLTAQRLPHGDGVLDLLADDRGLAAWQPGGSDGRRLWTRADLSLGAFDVMPHDGPNAAWILSCDGPTVDLRVLDLSDGSDQLDAKLDVSAEACALLGHRDQAPVVMVQVDGDLERWVFEDGAFTDRLVLARDVHLDAFRAVGREDGAMAFVDEGVLTVIDRDGRGLRLGDGTATDVFDVALGDGDVVVSWVDSSGAVWIGAGPIEGPVNPLRVAEGLVDAGPLSVGALDGELAVAVQDPSGLLLLRARR